MRARRARAGRRTGFLARAVGSSGPGASQRAEALLQPLVEKRASLGTFNSRSAPPCGWFLCAPSRASVFATLIVFARASIRLVACGLGPRSVSSQQPLSNREGPTRGEEHEARRSWRAKGGRAQHPRQKKSRAVGRGFSSSTSSKRKKCPSASPAGAMSCSQRARA